MLQNELVDKTSNVTLRAVSLAGKLALMLYMGRYLGLGDLGIYGIVFAAVMIFCVTLGGRLDYVVAREIVEAEPLFAFRKIRDQTIFWAINVAVFAVFVAFVWMLGLATPVVLLAVFFIASMESLANMVLANLVSLGHPLLSTFLFFVRAGLWGLIVVGLGLFVPATRHVEVVLAGWGLGSAVSLLLAVWFWRKAPWRELGHVPVDWGWMKRAVRQCFPIWLGTLGGAAALHVDRFVVSQYLTLEDVGVVTFYSSFAAALLALQQSGFFAFSYPRMIRFHKQGKTEAFWHETVRTAWQSSLFLALTAFAVGWALPLMAGHFQKPELAAQAPTLWLMLVAVWLRGNADALHYVLYARDQDWAIWTAGLLFLVPAALGNLLFIPWVGLIGVGYAGVLASLFLLGWRGYYVWRPEKKIR